MMGSLFEQQIDVNSRPAVFRHRLMTGAQIIARDNHANVIPRQHDDDGWISGKSTR